MKLRNLVLTVAAATLLPSLAFADNYDDAIRASLARDFGHEPAATYLPPARSEADPLDIIDVVLREKPAPVTHTVGSNSRHGDLEMTAVSESTGSRTDAP